MKKLFFTLMICFTFVTLPVKKSEAAVTVLAHQWHASLQTLKFLGGTVVLGNIYCYAVSKPLGRDCWDSSMNVAFVLFFGLIVLDDGASSRVEFKMLSVDELEEAGLDSAEIYAYQDSLEELNLVLWQVSRNFTEETTAEEGVKLWEKHGALLQPEVISAAQKILAYGEK